MCIQAMGLPLVGWNFFYLHDRVKLVQVPIFHGCTEVCFHVPGQPVTIWSHVLT
jgi:hypothetical protein